MDIPFIGKTLRLSKLWNLPAVLQLVSGGSKSQESSDIKPSVDDLIPG